MWKPILVLSCALTLSACGSEKSKDPGNSTQPVQVDASACPELSGKWHLFENGALDSSERIEITTRREGDRILYRGVTGQEFEPNGVEVLADAEEKLYGKAVCREKTLVVTQRADGGASMTMEMSLLSDTDLKVVQTTSDGTTNQIYRKVE